MKPILLTLATLALALSTQAAVETYKIDPTHSSIGFRIRHIFTKVPGEFTKFQGTIMVDRENPDKNSANATIDVASVNTRDEKRDAHLKNPDFFEVEKFPSMSFKSKSWTKTGETTFDVLGDLTIKNVTKEIVLKTKSLGFGPGMRPGSAVAGWEGTATVARKDFGINLNPMMEAALGQEVDVTINIEAGLEK